MDGTRKAHGCFIFIWNAVCIEVTEMPTGRRRRGLLRLALRGADRSRTCLGAGWRGRGFAVMTDVQCVGALLFASQREAPRTYEADGDA